MRLSFRIAIILILSAQSIFSQTFERNIRSKVESKQISAVDGLYYRALRFFAPDKLPAEYMTGLDQPVKCGTWLWHQLNVNRDKFSEEQKQVIAKILSRPDLPESYVSPNGLFRIHYTTDSYNAVSADDFDGSGIPDYVEETANSFDYSYQVEVENLGFNRPPNDPADGPEWDVYIEDLNGLYGYTSYSNNNGTYITYIVIDNDYTETNTHGVNGMRVTAAHEFNHMIQFGYCFREEDIFLMEAAATWMEDVVYTDINDYVYYLDSFFRQSNTPFNMANGLHEYGLCLWFHYLNKQYHDKSLAPKLWNNMKNYPAIDALDETLKQYNSSFSDDLSNFYMWNATTGPYADTEQFYREGNLYPVVKANGNYFLDNDTSFTVHIVGTGTAYYKFRFDNGYSYMLVPVNLRRTSHGVSDSAFIKIIGHYLPFYPSISSDVSAGVVSKNSVIWKMGAVKYDESGRVAEGRVYNGSVPLSDKNIPQCFPNPFNMNTYDVVTIPFISEDQDEVSLDIFSASGFPVYSSKKISTPSVDFFVWNGKDNYSNQQPSGIYVYIISDKNKIVRKGKIAVVR